MPHETALPRPGVVFVVDDDAAVRRSLALLLRSVNCSVDEHESAESFLTALPPPEGACLLLDLRMPGMDGLALQQELIRRGVQMPVVMITGHGDVGQAVRAMKAGAVDFIEKPYDEATILASVATAQSLAREASQRGRGEAEAIAKVAALSPRERDVLQGLIEGRSNKVIAHDLGISPRTVEIHRANMMERLRARSLSEAVRIALAAGFTPGVEG